MVFGVEPRPRLPRKGAPPEGRPTGAFGQEFPQNVPSVSHSAAVLDQGVEPLGLQSEAERVDSDGLPHVGAVVWPGQSYYTTLNKSNGAGGGLPCACDAALSPAPNLVEGVADMPGLLLLCGAGAVVAFMRRTLAGVNGSVHHFFRS